MSAAMKRVLFLAYFFPPIGGGGVQRSVKSVRYLPRYDYEPVVVTGPGAARGRSTPQDETLLGEIPASTDIQRVPGPEPTTSTGWRWRAERLLGVPAPFDRWWARSVVAKGREVGPSTDVILASSFLTLRLSRPPSSLASWGSRGLPIFRIPGRSMRCGSIPAVSTVAAIGHGCVLSSALPRRL